MANDYDANGDDIAISAMDTVTELGGSVTLQTASGDSVRDQLVYTPPTGILSPVTVGMCEAGTQLSPSDCTSCASYTGTTPVSCSDASACSGGELCAAGQCRASLGCDGTQVIDACGQPCPRAGLQVWLDTSDLETLEDSSGNRGNSLGHGSQIATIYDRSGNGNDAVCYHDDRRPELQLEGTNFLANRPAIHFAEDFMEMRGVDLNDASNDVITSVAAIRHIDGSGTRLVWVQQQNGFDSRRHAAFNTPDGATAVSSLILDLNEQEANYWLNTAPQSISEQSIYQPGGQGLGIGALLYANQGYAGAYFGNFVLGELLIYNRALADAELNQVQSYLIKKWGITIGDKFQYSIVDTSGNESTGQVQLELN